MKKRSVITAIVLVCSFTLYGAENFHIHGLDELVRDASAKAIADATNNLKTDVVPALQKALEETLDKSKPMLKEVAKDALVEAVPPILLSAAGLMVTSAGIMLVYQGLKADSTNNEHNCEKKVDTKKLLGYGSALIIIGVATIMHTSIRNLFSHQKS